MGLLHMGVPDDKGHIMETIVAKSGLVITFERINGIRIGLHRMTPTDQLVSVVFRCLTLIDPGCLTRVFPPSEDDENTRLNAS